MCHLVGTNADCPVGLNNVEVLNGVSIYPNPVQGIVNIAVPNVLVKLRLLSTMQQVLLYATSSKT